MTIRKHKLVNKRISKSILDNINFTTLPDISETAKRAIVRMHVDRQINKSYFVKNYKVKR